MFNFSLSKSKQWQIGRKRVETLDCGGNSSYNQTKHQNPPKNVKFLTLNRNLDQKKLSLARPSTEVRTESQA